jgi:hypothetical protein
MARVALTQQLRIVLCAGEVAGSSNNDSELSSCLLKENFDASYLSFDAAAGPAGRLYVSCRRVVLAYNATHDSGTELLTSWWSYTLPNNLQVQASPLSPRVKLQSPHRFSFLCVHCRRAQRSLGTAPCLCPSATCPMVVADVHYLPADQCRSGQASHLFCAHADRDVL